MADTQKLRDLAASYRLRCSEGASDLMARYNLDMARYLDSIVATVEAAVGHEACPAAGLAEGSRERLIRP